MKADQHRQRNDGCSNQRGTNVAEEEEKNDRYEDETLEEVLLDGVNRSVDHR